MPIQTPAFRLVCLSCGWSKLFATMGDVRLPSQVPDKCPSCGSAQLSHGKPNIAEKILASIKSKL
jgi:hypothetical protein